MAEGKEFQTSREKQKKWRMTNDFILKRTATTLSCVSNQQSYIHMGTSIYYVITFGGYWYTDRTPLPLM